MNRILTLVALSLASFAYGCHAETASVEDSTAALTESEAAFVGDYHAATGSLDEIQLLTLSKDNSFTGQIATSATGEKVNCAFDPCTSEVSGTWSVNTKANEKVSLTLSIAGESARDLVYAVTAGPGAELTLERASATIKLTKWIVCAQISATPLDPTCGEWAPTYDANGCYTGDLCVAKIQEPKPQPMCPSVEIPADAKCDGTWVAQYNADGCFTGNVCTPNAPPTP